MVIDKNMKCSSLTEVEYSPQDVSFIFSPRESPKSATLQNNDSFTKILRAARSCKRVRWLTNEKDIQCKYQCMYWYGFMMDI